VPNLMANEKLDQVVLSKMGIPFEGDAELSTWNDFIWRLKSPKEIVRIGLIGKYIELKDSYKSIVESFIHAGAANGVKVKLEWIHSESLSKENVAKKLSHLDGVLVAPGFGGRGIEGKIEAIRYVREKEIPFFGICLGMQCAVIEYGRNVLGLNEAHSTEMDPDTEYPVIDIMEHQKSIINKGGTMRLGLFPCQLKEDSIAMACYGKKEIMERHRHRYEFNNDFQSLYESKGMRMTGVNPESRLVEIIEIPEHPWFVGVQFHPEYKSTVAEPHPLFIGFVQAALAGRKVEETEKELVDS
jgi:CTP synthase